MFRFALLVVLVVAVGAPSARGQDADEVKRLKKENELLTKEVELLKKEIDQLKKDLEQLKAGKRPVDPPKPTLSDLLTEGAVVRGDYRFSTGNKATGEWTLAIKERTGNKFKGTYTAKHLRPLPEGPGTEVDAEGTIAGNTIKFSPVYTTKMMFTATGTLTKEVLNLDFSGRGGLAAMTAKVKK